MLIILSLLSLENHISLPKHSLRYSSHIEVIFPLKQFKFWIKEYSKKQVWNKKINECSFFVFFSPISFSLSRWGIWVFSSCCCFSYLQLLEWSCLETLVSLPVPVEGVGAVCERGSHGCAWSRRVRRHAPLRGAGTARHLQKLWDGLSDSLPSIHGRQLERDNESKRPVEKKLPIIAELEAVHSAPDW